MPEVDVENFSGEVEVDVGVVGIISGIWDCDIQRDILHSSEGQMGFAMQSSGDIRDEIRKKWEVCARFILYFLLNKQTGGA